MCVFETKIDYIILLLMAYNALFYMQKVDSNLVILF